MAIVTKQRILRGLPSPVFYNEDDTVPRARLLRGGVFADATVLAGTQPFLIITG